jgi:hypothetical protein
MKKTAILIMLAAFSFASCEKETNDDHLNSNASTDVTIEYRITDESSNIQVEMIAPDAAQHLTTVKQTITKTYTSVQFVAKNHNTFSIKAWNTDPSWKNINVDIYVNGHLVRSGTLDHATATASASAFVE